MLNNHRLMILGTGNMGSCLLGGIRRANLVPPDQIVITGLRSDYLKDLADQWKVRWTTDNREAIREADIVMICLKPQAIERVAEQVRDLLRPDQLLITIAAGVTTSGITEMIRTENPVVRVPSDFVLVGRVFSLLSGIAHTLGHRANVLEAMGAST